MKKDHLLFYLIILIKFNLINLFSQKFRKNKLKYKQQIEGRGTNENLHGRVQVLAGI